jgi:acyl carrier protein
MGRLIDVLVDTFPTLDRNTVLPSLRIGDIPMWDSMAAVNLLISTEDTFKISLRNVDLHGNLTIGDFADMIRAQGAAIE